MRADAIAAPSVVDRGRIVRFPGAMDERDRERLREQLKNLIDDEFIGGQRGKLASCLRELLEPDEDGVLAQGFSIETDRTVLKELVGSLYDANRLESELHDAFYLRQRWRELEQRLRGVKTNGIPAVLRDFGLRKASLERSILHRRLEMAVCYCRLVTPDPRFRHPHVHSPERERWRLGIDQPIAERPFGHIYRDDLGEDVVVLSDLEPLGETISTPISTVEAVHLIDRWFDCGGALKARGQLIEARDEFRVHLDHPLVRGRIPPGCDDFEIPNEYAFYK